MDITNMDTMNMDTTRVNTTSMETTNNIEEGDIFDDHMVFVESHASELNFL
jgi:hypothetical protein